MHINKPYIPKVWVEQQYSSGKLYPSVEAAAAGFYSSLPWDFRRTRKNVLAVLIDGKWNHYYDRRQYQDQEWCSFGRELSIYRLRTEFGEYIKRDVVMAILDRQGKFKPWRPYGGRVHNVVYRRDPIPGVCNYNGGCTRQYRGLRREYADSMDKDIKPYTRAKRRVKLKELVWDWDYPQWFWGDYGWKTWRKTQYRPDKKRT